MSFSFTALLLLLRLFAGFAQDQKSSAPILPPQKIPSCSLFDRATTGDSIVDRDAIQSRLLATYNNQARLVRSMKAIATIRATRGPKFGAKAGTSRPITGFFDFEQPALMRVTGVAEPMGRKVFDMASDGREFRLLAPDHETMKLYVGLVDAQPNMSEISAPEISDIARPREILDALRWQEGTLRKTAQSSAVQSDTIEFDLPARAGKPITGKLHFDLQSGEITSLEIYADGTDLISEISYADWQPLSDSSARSTHGCFPRRVRLVQPMEDIQLDFHFLELTLNPHIPRARFRLNPAPGIPVVRLSPAGVANDD
jgi:hypothetical protein